MGVRAWRGDGEAQAGVGGTRSEDPDGEEPGMVTTGETSVWLEDKGQRALEGRRGHVLCDLKGGCRNLDFIFT